MKMITAKQKSTALFPLGQTVMTRGIALAYENRMDEIAVILRRHASGDWGIVCDEDKEANDFDLANGGRLVSTYALFCEPFPQKSDRTEKIYVITEWDRSLTTVLYPSEY